jgi:quinol---cytochrome c reductase iron-sulfur subunit, bacillus type
MAELDPTESRLEARGARRDERPASEPRCALPAGGTRSREPQAANQPRRRFLAYLVGVLGAAIGAILAVPLAVFSIKPAFKRAKKQWLELGPVEDVAVGKPTPFPYRYHNFDGYLDNNVRGTAYAVTEDGRDFIVLSNVCTHAGCGVRWEEEKKGYFCPCHNGLFDKTGKVISGPPPRPLDRFRWKIEGGKLFIEMKEA